MNEKKAFDETINHLRQDIKDIAKSVKRTKENKGSSETNSSVKSPIKTHNKEDIGEIMANLTLCYRHLEDSSMRLGKVLQARNSGVSIYSHTERAKDASVSKGESVVGDPEENEG